MAVWRHGHRAPYSAAAFFDLFNQLSFRSFVGPAYKDVAAKYKGDKTAEAKLIEKVKKGGSGVWGPMPMPPNGQVKDEDIKTLVKWVLAH